MNDELKEALLHYSIYGAPGEPPASRVDNNRYGIQPLQDPATAPWDVPLGRADLEKLIIGFCPQEMEHKWLCCSDDPDGQGNIVVHMYRSWTGQEQFTLQVAVSRAGGEDQEEGKARIAAIK